MTGLRPAGFWIPLALLGLAYAPAVAASPPHVEIKGAGSTFIAPLMNKWTSEFAKSTDMQVYYLSVGSSAGISQMLAETVELGTTDSPLTDGRLAAAKVPLEQIPLAMGAVVPIYNLPGLSHPVRFTPEVLTGILLGEITTWRDPGLVAVNPHLELPDLPITVVHRSDDSGTTFALTDYLSKVSNAWKSQVGASSTVAWPVGVAAKGNEGVTVAVRQTPGAVGFTEISYALRSRVAFGELKNQAGHFVEANVDSLAAAAVGGSLDDIRRTLTNSTAKNAWPISTMTWAVINPRMAPGRERDTLFAFLHWATREGQAYCEPLGYAPLPPELMGRTDDRLTQLGGR